MHFTRLDEFVLYFTAGAVLWHVYIRPSLELL